MNRFNAISQKTRTTNIVQPPHFGITAINMAITRYYCLEALRGGGGGGSQYPNYLTTCSQTVRIRHYINGRFPVFIRIGFEYGRFVSRREKSRLRFGYSFRFIYDYTQRRLAIRRFRRPNRKRRPSAKRPNSLTPGRIFIANSATP